MGTCAEGCSLKHLNINTTDQSLWVQALSHAPKTADEMKPVRNRTPTGMS